jgi:hypothetical protein
MTAGIPSPGTITAIALAWGLLVWLNWFRANPLSMQSLKYALATWALIRPLPSLDAWLRHAAFLAELGCLGLAAFGAGRAALGFLRAESRPLAGPNALALGAGALGLGTMGAGLAGLAFPGLARAAVAAFGLLGFIAGASKAGDRRASLAALRRGMAGRFAGLRGFFSVGNLPLSLAVLFALFIPLIGALAPEASFDGQAHHLAHPGLYAGHHKVFVVPWHFLANYPALLEMQYLLAMLFSGESQVAKLTHYGWGLVTASAVYLWAREGLPERWALAALAGFLLLPYIQLVMMWSYVDLGAAAYFTLTVRAALGRPNPVLAGALGGLCAGVKVSGVFAPALAAVALASVRIPLSGWAAFLAAGFLTANVWAVKNWLFTGNPVMPFLPGLIPTLWWGPENLARYSRELASYATGHYALRNWLAIPAQPWDISIWNTGVLDGMGGIGGWFLWLLPLLLLIRTPAASAAALVTFGYLVLWQFIPRQVRYTLPVWPVAVLAGAHALKALGDRGRVSRAAVTGAAAVLILHLVLAVVRQNEAVNPIGVVFGGESSEAYMGRGMPGKRNSIDGRRWVAGLGGPGRMLSMDQYGLGLFWGPRAIVQSFFDVPLIERFARESRTPAEIGKRFRQMGITLALYDAMDGGLMQTNYAVFNFDPGSAARWRDFWTTSTRLAHRQGGQYLFYRVGRPAGGPPEKPSVWPGLDEQWLAGLDEAYTKASRQGDLAARLPGLTAEYEKAARELGSPACYERLGLILLARDQRSQARTALSTARRLGRESARLHLALGVLLAWEGKMAGAVPEFRLALALDPGDPAIRRNLVQGLLNLKDGAGALATLREGLELDPGSAELQAMWGRLTGKPPP